MGSLDSRYMLKWETPMEACHVVKHPVPRLKMLLYLDLNEKRKLTSNFYKDNKNKHFDLHL